MKRVSPAALKAAISDRAELAILDAREEGEFGTAHLFWASPLPLSRLPLIARALVPNPAARVVVTDDGRGLAERAARELAALGYSDVAVLDGGTPAWDAAGYVLFSGVNVPSKAFGEWVEHHYGTESIDAADLKALADRGERMVILDSRPLDEFRRMSIPGGINVPGGELAYRIGSLVPDPDTLVVVNCAGRTRSILGAESLRSAGIPNRVLALRNGTMGWELAGFACARGETARYPEGTPPDLDTALARAEALRVKHKVGLVDRETVDAWAADGTRTLYLLDVRDPAEFAESHIPGSRSAPGGQLVQATDGWIAVRNARIVLVDDTGVRARMAAQWLAQMGHRDIHVLEGGLVAPLVTGPWVPDVALPEVEALPLRAVHAALAAGQGRVVDLARSIAFRDGHIPGSLWGVRTRLDALAARLPETGLVAVTSPDDNRTASLAVEELADLTAARVGVLEGGVAVWAAAGLPLAADRTNPPDEACIDAYLRPYDRNSGVEAAMVAYLSWEIDLVKEIARDGDAPFG
ncbi:rhodanese-like domain-containing protein [Elioraea sp.]|uniref:rhodanese-like domain-containing protein n=1 Tax=Elioraea sp. TaxID=2185103 RepID=UPI0025C5E62D|nr:rhodanese-like domain-containing protein [Elioraea sp.]